MDVNRARFAEKILAPDRGQQLLARERPAGVCHERVQQLELLERELDTDAVGRNDVLTEVHLKAADADQLLLFRRAAAAAQHRTDSRGHLHHAERLCKIVVRAEVKADDLVVLVALGRRHDDRDVGRARVGFQALEDGYAVLARQHDVEHY